MATEERKGTDGISAGAATQPHAARPVDPGHSVYGLPSLAGRTVLIVGRGSPELRQFSIWVDQFGGLGFNVQHGDSALQWLQRQDSGQSFVIFDADDIGDADDVVDFGFALRRQAPNAPIIMLSSQVRRNDFSSARMMICDATLKNPVTLTAFRLGLEAALENHVKYLSATQPEMQS
ncbi:hypothetical protein [Pseudorhodobacter sp.]|uniref:hypothetical protein n=1 Tax=Pseudorhodobacter sp. TaxID=1934400 RepID=UPI002AFFD2BD|nr:hypothetical protein [Pseudorhodobacter sp.]